MISEMKRISKKPISRQIRRSHQSSFQEVIQMIEVARRKAYHAVNTELIDLYWRVGEYISKKMDAAEWGEAIVNELAACIKKRHPEIRGFARANLFRMRQ